MVKNLLQEIKIKFFKTIEPAFPYVRDVLVNSGIVRHKGRQRYLLGHLPHNKSVDDYVEQLEQFGFSKYKIAWIDEGEVFGMRKLDSLEYCYHIRIFADGEIRGHYEKTVEIHPWDHFFEIGMQSKTEKFRQFLGPLLVPVQHEAEAEKLVAIIAY